jgi:hypothetical protein
VAGGAVVAVPELPQFEMTRAPFDPPVSVSAGAHAKGLFVAQGPTNQVKFRLVQVFSSPAEARQFSKRGGVVQEDSQTPHPCTYITDDPSDFGQPWSALATTSISHIQGSDRPAVVGLHVETVEGEWTRERGGSLGIVDGWLDVRSRGLKVLEQKTMPVKQVAEGPFGVRVFAARGADTVHFVVLPPPLATKPPAFLGSPFERPLIRSGGVVGNTECRHARVTLEATRGKGAQATVSIQRLQPVPADPIDPEAENDEIPEMTMVQVLEVHLSATQNAIGTPPVVSVGFHVGAPQLLE